MDLNHPLIESVVLPLALVLLFTAALRHGLGPHRGRTLAAAAVGATVLIAWSLIFGAPTWPARSGIEKLPFIFALALAGGIAADMARPGRLVTAAAIVAAVVIIALWLGWPQLSGGDPEPLWRLAMAAVLAFGALAGLAATPPEGANRAAMLVAAALGLAGAAFNAGSLALFQVALALAAAVGGFGLWNWPTPRLPFGASGVAVAGLGCFALALLLLLLTQIRPWALLPLPLVFLSAALSRRLPVPGRLERTLVEPLYVVAIGLVPALLAILLAQAPPPTDDIYYR